MTRYLWSAVAIGLAACSPALNWRTVRLDEAALASAFPCKPEREARRVELGGQGVDMQMWGCEADGATFAVAHAELPAGALPGVALAHWKAATAARVGAAPAGDAVAFAPAGALALPEAGRVQWQGQRPGGGAVTLQGAWFARVAGPQVHVYHAAVYSPAPRPTVADTFFAGLVLQ